MSKCAFAFRGFTNSLLSSRPNERIEFQWIDHKDLCDLKLRPRKGSSERPDDATRNYLKCVVIEPGP